MATPGACTGCAGTRAPAAGAAAAWPAGAKLKVGAVWLAPNRLPPPNAGVLAAPNRLAEEAPKPGLGAAPNAGVLAAPKLNPPAAGFWEARGGGSRASERQDTQLDSSTTAAMHESVIGDVGTLGACSPGSTRTCCVLAPNRLVPPKAGVLEAPNRLADEAPKAGADVAPKAGALDAPNLRQCCQPEGAQLGD